MRHQPFWCEENIWHLADDPAVGPGERWVVVLTGASGHVACWNQRAADPGEPVLWDYHVVLAVRSGDGMRIWDLDTRLDCPSPAAAWIAGTFPEPLHVRPAFRPRLQWSPADEFRRAFTSDRSHMRTADGGWQQPPPPWPAIVGGDTSLADYVGRARRGSSLDAFERWCAGS